MRDSHARENHHVRECAISTISLLRKCMVLKEYHTREFAESISAKLDIEGKLRKLFKRRCKRAKRRL